MQKQGKVKSFSKNGFFHEHSEKESTNESTFLQLNLATAH